MWGALVSLALVALPSVRANDCNQSFPLTPGENVTFSVPINPDTGKYYKNMICQKNFTSDNYQVSFILTCPDDQFNVRKTRRRCQAGDYLYVTDDLTIYDYFCGRIKPGMVMSGGPFLEVIFRSRAFGKAGKGVTCTVSTVETPIPEGPDRLAGPRDAADRLAGPRDAADPPPPFVPKKGYKCMCGEQRTSRIIGGSATDVHEYPWVVTVSQRGMVEPLCTGVLVDDRHVLTAGRCVADTNNLQVRLAETDLAKVSRSIVRDVVLLNTKNDVAVLNFTRPVNLGSEHPMRPPCMPDGTINFNSKTATLTGFGGVRAGDEWTPTMNKITVPLASSCTNEGKLCSNAVISLCSADSGSPIVIQKEGRAVLAGIVPSVTACTTRNKFVDIQQLDWLPAVIADGVTCRDTLTPPS